MNSAEMKKGKGKRNGREDSGSQEDMGLWDNGWEKVAGQEKEVRYEVSK